MLQTAETAHTAQTNQMKEELRKALHEALLEAQDRLVKAQAAVQAAEAEFRAFTEAFPAPVAAMKEKVSGKQAVIAVSKPVNGGRPQSNGKVTAVQSRKHGGTVMIGRLPRLKTGENATVPERCAAVMGKRIYTAGDLQDELKQQGEKFKSNNLRSYISTTLNSTLMPVPAPDGSQLRDRDGQVVKVHMFTAVERGQYRVSTAEDIQNELKKLFNVSEVMVADRSAAAEQSGDEAERPALLAAQH